MKKCSLCGKKATSLFGDNYCVFCGGKTIDVSEKHICDNPECDMHIRGWEFSQVCKFCGECGSPIVVLEKNE